MKMRELLREIFGFFMFLWILYVVSYSNSNSDSFNFKKSIQNTLVSSNLEIDFNQVRIIFEISRKTHKTSEYHLKIS